MDTDQQQNIVIRRAIPADISAITQCVAAAYQHYTARMGKPPAPMSADYAAIVAGDGAFVGVLDGVTVGVLVLAMRDDEIMLENIAVHPACQGKGIGKQLMAFAEHETRRCGYQHITLYTNEAMTESLAIYAHLGFTEVDRRNEDGYRRVYLSKHLDAS